jgi:hypothetical protein
MAKINSKTMLFEELSGNEASCLEQWVKSVILDGKFINNDLVDRWCREFGFSHDLLVMSTALPQKVALSLMIHKDKLFEKIAYGGEDW